ncbi:MAG: enoyl-CoA hydratase-related protein [Desulfobacterales bacterium]|nr:enoyl-CoA hydratase-related protein [Desulfobacterales bacterium]
MSRAIQVEVQDGLTTLTLANPEKGNPIDGNFGVELRQVVNDLRQQAGLRAVLLCAQGDNFSFGGDLKVFAEQLDQLPEIITNWTADLNVALQRFWTLPVPIVCAVQGFTMGGALSLAAGCDFVIAGRSARLGSAFAQIGFSCDSGSSVTLSARMGASRARRFVLLGEVLEGEAAQAAGLVDQVVADGELQTVARQLALRLASGPTQAYGEIKRLFRAGGAAVLEGQLEDEARTLARIAATLDAREGIASRVAKRKPIFQGR